MAIQKKGASNTGSKRHDISLEEEKFEFSNEHAQKICDHYLMKNMNYKLAI